MENQVCEAITSFEKENIAKKNALLFFIYGVIFQIGFYLNKLNKINSISEIHRYALEAKKWASKKFLIE